jgi:hypothetical protein
MRFPRSFTRVVGSKTEGFPLSEEEGPPVGPLDETAAAASLGADNVLVSRQANTMGWPAQRIAVAWIAPATELPKDSTNAGYLDLRAFIFDHLTGCWLATSVIDGAAERRLHFIDVPCLLDVPTAGRKGGQIASPQALEVMLVPRPITNGHKVEKSYRAGAYTFVFGADVSNTP